MNLDELFARIEEDTLRDATKLSPIEYARLRRIYPQKVYKAIRNHKLEWEYCQCGRKVIDVATADTLFGFKKENADGEEADL